MKLARQLSDTVGTNPSCVVEAQRSPVAQKAASREEAGEVLLRPVEDRPLHLPQQGQQEWRGLAPRVRGGSSLGRGR